MIIVTSDTNFIRIFRLPVRFPSDFLDYPSDFCFAGGCPVSMQLVDWFNPHSAIDSPIRLNLEELEVHRNEIKEFIRQKKYFTDYPDNKFLAITDYGDSYLISYAS